MDLELAGRSVLVTGASRGIGRAVVEGFAREGVSTIHATARSASDLDGLVSDVAAQWGTTVVPHVLDLSVHEDRCSLDDVVDEVDVLVNNAGAIPPGPLDRIDLDAWRSAWDLKLWGYVELSRRALAAMTGRRSGVIVNVIGLSGERHDARYIAGSMGNAALMAFTRTVGAGSLDDGVRVVGVNPGPVETSRLVTALRNRAQEQFADAERWRDYTTGYPGGRMATTDEVADLVLFLASDRSAYISGTVVTLDGGMAWRGVAF